MIVAIGEIDVDGLAAVARESTVFDVREPDEYRAGHVPGAINVPLATVPENLLRMAGGGEVYVICQAGGRSMSACMFLDENAPDSGTTFVNVTGGTGGWVMAGHEVVVGDQPG